MVFMLFSVWFWQNMADFCIAFDVFPYLVTVRSESKGNIDRSGSKPWSVKWALMTNIYKSWTSGKLIEVVLHWAETERKISVLQRWLHGWKVPLCLPGWKKRYLPANQVYFLQITFKETTSAKLGADYQLQGSDHSHYCFNISAFLFISAGTRLYGLPCNLTFLGDKKTD